MQLLDTLIGHYRSFMFVSISKYYPLNFESTVKYWSYKNIQKYWSLIFAFVSVEFWFSKYWLLILGVFMCLPVWRHNWYGSHLLQNAKSAYSVYQRQGIRLFDVSISKGGEIMGHDLKLYLSASSTSLWSTRN